MLKLVVHKVTTGLGKVNESNRTKPTRVGSEKSNLKYNFEQELGEEEQLNLEEEKNTGKYDEKRSTVNI
jgi:hypothetical protein